MKASIFACLVAFQWQVSATPINSPASTDVVPYMEKKQFRVTVDCNELINQVLRTVNAYPYYTSQAVAVGKKVILPSATAFSICKTFKTQAVDCSYAAGSVAGGISLAIIHGFIDLNPPEEGATTATSKREELLHDHVDNYLRSTGANFESISVLPLMDRREDDRNNSVESGHFMEVRGAREPGQVISTDFHITSRLDGSGDVQTTPFSEDSVARRQSTKSGYKIAWEVSTWSHSSYCLSTPLTPTFELGVWPHRQ